MDKPPKFRLRPRVSAAPRWNFRLIDLITLLLLFGVHLGVIREWLLAQSQHPDRLSATLGAAGLGAAWTLFVAWTALKINTQRKVEHPLHRALWILASDVALILAFPICIVLAPFFMLVLLPIGMARSFIRTGTPRMTDTGRFFRRKNRR